MREGSSACWRRLHGRPRAGSCAPARSLRAEREERSRAAPFGSRRGNEQRSWTLSNPCLARPTSVCANWRSAPPGPRLPFTCTMRPGTKSSRGAELRPEPDRPLEGVKPIRLRRIFRGRHACAPQDIGASVAARVAVVGRGKVEIGAPDRVSAAAAVADVVVLAMARAKPRTAFPQAKSCGASAQIQPCDVAVPDLLHDAVRIDEDVVEAALGSPQPQTVAAPVESRVGRIRC